MSLCGFTFGFMLTISIWSRDVAKLTVMIKSPLKLVKERGGV